MRSPRPPNKRFRVVWEGDESTIIGSLDTLDESISFARKLRLDRKHFVRDIDKIVWPENFEPARG